MIKAKNKDKAVFALVLTLLVSNVVIADTMIDRPSGNQWGMTAPFLASWLPIWVFSIAGGIGSIFIKVGDIDSNFRWLYLAKPYLGVFGGLILAMTMTDGGDPPDVMLTAYSGGASFMSSSILQFILVMLSSKRNSLAVINKISPVQFELPDKGDSHDKS